MKRKCSLLLVLCLFIGLLSPAVPVNAGQIIEDTEIVEEMIGKETEVIEKISEEEVSITISSVELTQQEIPDSVFWSYLVNTYGTDGVLTTDSLLDVRYLSIPTSNGVIRDLTGIEYLMDLKGVDLSSHEITDAGVQPLLSCTGITEINLINNELTIMPDFSKMTNLTRLTLFGNRIPEEEITEDKYPEGIDILFLPQRSPLEIEVVGGKIYKDNTGDGTYGVSLKITGSEYMAFSMGLKITDITDGSRNVLCEISELDCIAATDNDAPYSSRYVLFTGTSGIRVAEGVHTWEVTCEVENTTVTNTLSVVADPDGVGGFQPVPENILPESVAEYLVDTYTSLMNNRHCCDIDGDGRISFFELEFIDYVTIDGKNLSGIETFEFLSYMANVSSLTLAECTDFGQEALTYLSGLEYLEGLTLRNVGNITDISVLKNIKQLNRLEIYGANHLEGLEELKGCVGIINADSGTFTDEDIFNFICSTKEEKVYLGIGKHLVSTGISMESEAGVQISVSENGIINYSEENPFYVYGVKVGETDITYSFGDSVYTIHVTVEGEEWNPDPELGTIVEENQRIRFTGTEGILSARVNRTLMDEEKNIWNISTHTPEKILEEKEYTKYASRILCDSNGKETVDTGFYLDKAGTLWLYNSGEAGAESNFTEKYEIMSNVADWQESGYSEDSNYANWGGQYILVQRTDGSLWYCTFDYGHTAGNKFLRPYYLEKLEDSGVTGVYPYSYVKDGSFYCMEFGSKKLIAENIVKVWDNTSVALAQDKLGKYYTINGKVNVTGNVKEFLTGSYYEPDYYEKLKDMIPGYLLMDNGTLYRTDNSRFKSTYFVQVDTDVTALEKDYYWKGDQLYSLSGELYEEYIGNGAGIGVYPVWERDDTLGISSITLYCNGVKCLTKVADWTETNNKIYAVRLDNSLWQLDRIVFGEPRKIELSALNNNLKESQSNQRDIDIVDLQQSLEGLMVKWSSIDGAVSYQLEVSDSYESEKINITDITETEYTIPLEMSTCPFYKIQAMGANGEVLAESWNVHTLVRQEEIGKITGMSFKLLDEKGTEVAAEGAGYFLNYAQEMKGKKLLLEVTVEGNESAAICAESSDPAVASVLVDGHKINLKIQGDGCTRITVKAQEGDYEESVYLYLQDYTPRITNTAIELNRALSKEVMVAAYPIYGTKLTVIEPDIDKLTAKEIKADYINYFRIIPTEEGIKITLDDSLRNSKLRSGTYRLPLKLTVEDFSQGNISEEPKKIEGISTVLTIKLSEIKPKITLKAEEKINLFYTDTQAVYSLKTSAGEITKAEFEPLNGKVSYFTANYDLETGRLVLTPKTGSDGKTLWNLSTKEVQEALKGVLKLTIGESIFQQKLTLAKSNVKPMVALTKSGGKVYKYTGETGIYYVGNVIHFQPIDKKTKEPYENVQVTLAGYETTKNGVTVQSFSPGKKEDGSEKDYVLNKDEQGRYTIYFIGNTSSTAILKIQGSNWKEPVSVKYKATVTGVKLKAKLNASKVTLNKHYSGDQKTLMLTTNLEYKDFKLGDWKVTKLPKGAVDGNGLEVQKTEKGLVFVLKEEDKANLKEGTYTVTIPVTFEFEDGASYTPTALTVKVNVIKKELSAKDVKWKAVGKLDVINRENSKIEVTPTISKLNAVITDARFSEKDKNAGLDQKMILKVESGKLKIQLKPGAYIDSKRKYEIHPIITVNTEKGTSYTISDAAKIIVKPIQSKVKITANTKSLTMYKSVEATWNQSFSYTIKGEEGVQIDRIVSSTSGFVASLLNDRNIYLKLSDEYIQAKTYTVMLDVYLKDYDTNLKPVKMKIKVNLKK